MIICVGGTLYFMDTIYVHIRLAAWKSYSLDLSRQVSIIIIFRFASPCMVHGRIVFLSSNECATTVNEIKFKRGVLRT